MSVPSSPVGLLPAFTPQGYNDHTRSGDKFKIHEDYNNGELSLPSSPVMKKRNPVILEESTSHNQQFYPTPMPTSSGAGTYDRSSSPVRAALKSLEQITGDLVDENSAPSCIQQGRTPLAQITVLKLPRNGEPMTIGRSSQSCDVAVSSKNKLVSRIHAQARYHIKDHSITIDCLGWNGLTVIVPGENGHQAEYEINKGQSLTSTYTNGVKLDIRGEQALVLVDEEETDDEVPTRLPVTNSSNSIQSEKPKPLKQTPPAQEHRVENRKRQSTPLGDGRTKTPKTPKLATPTSRPAAKEAMIQEPTPKKSGLSPAISKPIAENKPEAAETIVEEQSAEKPSKKPKLDDDGIKHILANHLAFSRLSSTPLSTICKSNSALTKLDRQFVRALLESIACVGVIHRTGKDASGRPLEEEYYYIPENDSDDHRRNMAEQSRGHIGLRSCRKQHKQYFWKKPTK